VVEEYVATAQPVGSQTVARSRSLGVSSATVRNDMNLLEHEGYIVQPHTSAGRIPTDQGYRYFVDHLIDEDTLPEPERRAVADFFLSAHRALEDLLHETSHFLADVTEHAAVVVGPTADAATLRSVQLVTLQPGVVLAVGVMSNGAVKKEVVQLERELDEATVGVAAAALDLLVGRAVTEFPAVQPTGNPEVDQLAGKVRDAFAAHRSEEPLYVGGASRLAAEHEAFATAESAARLLEMLEHQVVVVALVRDLLDQGVTVRIGSENTLEELRDCAIVLAPYLMDGELAGTVGVLGPTRMDYRQARAAVAAVSQQLGRLLS